MDQLYINLGKEKIPVKIEEKGIFELSFYKKNPRIASIISKKGEDVSPEFIDKELWERNPTRHVFRRIEKHGGLIHPIIVYNNEVLEGNTRLCAYRHLYSREEEEGKNPEKWSKITCKVIQSELDKNKIYQLLADEHLEGKVEWDPYEKACWVWKMLHEDNIDYPEIEQITGLSRTKIDQKLISYETMVKENVEDPKKYSYFEQLFSNQEITRIKTHEDPDIQKKTIEAIKKGQLKDAKDVRKIPVIHKDKKAKKALFTDGEEISTVYHDLKSKNPTIDSTFVKACEELTRRTKQLKRKDREELVSDNRTFYIIKQLKKEVNNLFEELEKLKK